MPWILWGPAKPPDSTGLSSGSTATTLIFGRRDFSTSPTPVKVPPVPMPPTTMSRSPSQSRQISSAVVRRWISGLAGFSNCWRMRASVSSLSISSARRTAPRMPSVVGVISSSAPISNKSLRLASDMLLGMVRISRYPLAAQTKASASPVLPEVGSISTVSGPIRPSFSAASIMARPMRSLTEPSGLKNSSLPSSSALHPSSPESLASRTNGVLPMVSKMLSWMRPFNAGLFAREGHSATRWAGLTSIP